jgi:hypothetical protein
LRTTHNPVFGYEADRAITLEEGRIVKEENLKLLRDKNFQDLLYPYSRRKRTFIIAHQNQDSALT